MHMCEGVQVRVSCDLKGAAAVFSICVTPTPLQMAAQHPELWNQLLQVWMDQYQRMQMMINV